MSKIKYSLNISEVTAMSIPGFPASSPHPHLGWCISLLCGKDVGRKQSWHPHLHVWGPLGGWSGAAGGPIVFFFCFLNFFCHFSCPGPAFRGVQFCSRGESLTPSSSDGFEGKWRSKCSGYAWHWEMIVEVVFVGCLLCLRTQLWPQVYVCFPDRKENLGGEREEAVRGNRESSEVEGAQPPANSVSSSCRPFNQKFIS